MSGKRIVATVILLLLMFMSTVGQTSEQLLQAGADLNQASSASMLTGVITTVLVSTQMVLIPLICRLVKKEKLPQKSGKQISLWNSIGMFLVSVVISTMQLPLPIGVGGMGALIFYFINKWLFVAEED